MSDGKLRQDAARGTQAALLLENPLLVEAFATLRASYLEAWENSAVRDGEAREKLWQAVQIVGKVQSHLQKVVDGGKLASAEIREIELRPKRFSII